MSDAYSSKYVDVVKNCAKECNIDVKEGVYMFLVVQTMKHQQK